MRRAVEYFHPLVWFIYFLTVLIEAMLFIHPFFIATGLFCSLTVCLTYCGIKKLIKTLTFAMPIFLLIALFNPLVNHGGRTVLFHIIGSTFTLEALIYGLCSGGMLLIIFIWFTVYNTIITSEKFLFIFSRILPSAALLITMTQRMVPMFARRAETISSAQKTLLSDMSQGSLSARFKSGLRTISVLMSWSMEDGLDTADSMKARGYGVTRRSFFSLYRFRLSDALSIAAIILCFSVTTAAYYLFVELRFYPSFYLPPLSFFGTVSVTAYSLLMLMPILALFVDYNTNYK